MDNLADIRFPDALLKAPPVAPLREQNQRVCAKAPTAAGTASACVVTNSTALALCPGAPRTWRSVAVPVLSRWPAPLCPQEREMFELLLTLHAETKHTRVLLALLEAGVVATDVLRGQATRDDYATACVKAIGVMNAS